MRETATASDSGLIRRESRDKAATPAARMPDGRTPPAGYQPRRRWTLSLAAGIVLVDAFSIVLAVTHHHFAVS